MKLGQLTKRGPTKLESKDIEFGWTMAKEMGRLDIGQSVTVKGRAGVGGRGDRRNRRMHSPRRQAVRPALP